MSSPPAAAASPFDALAADYDAAFVATDLGRRYRAAVWRRLAQRFRAGQRVLELNCGTGEDALELARRGVRVVATDVSAAMLERTRAKVDAAGLGGLVETRLLAIEDLAGAVGELGRFDGALSDFGGLNCVPDLAPVADALGAAIRPGGAAVLCLMGPAVPWEWAWHLARRDPRRAFRRLGPATTWRGLALSYPSVRAARRAFAPAFEVQRTAAIGALLPPPYAEAWAARHPRLVERLDRVERRVEAAPGLASLADHYLVEAVRR